MHDEEHPFVYMFLIGLEDDMVVDALALTHHMDHHARNFFANFGREHFLD